MDRNFGLSLLVLFFLAPSANAFEQLWSPNQLGHYAIRGSDCAWIRSQQPKTCQPMTAEGRRRILALSHPSRYPRTRYQLPPRSTVPFSVETDCTRFVHAIYTQSGYPVPSIPTGGYSCLSTFRVIPEAQAQAGDVVLYPGHVGILEKNGRVVSATLGGRGRPATLPSHHPNFVSSIQSIERNQLARGPSQILRWQCQ